MPDAKMFVKLRQQAGWGSISLHQARNALSHSLYGVTAYNQDQVVGMARAIGDGYLNIYIQDVVIAQPHRGNGLGRALIMRLISIIRQMNAPDNCTIGLMAATGQEGFYETIGFIARRPPHFGAGMTARLGDLP